MTINIFTVVRTSNSYKEKTAFGKPRGRREDYIEMHFREFMYEGVDFMQLMQAEFK
jgi:hypothetical protein